MHLVQTRIRFTLPSTFALTRWRLGIQRRFVLLLAWLTLLPTDGRLPQIVHIQAMASSSSRGFCVNTRAPLPQGDEPFREA